MPINVEDSSVYSLVYTCNQLNYLPYREGEWVAAYQL